MIKRLLATAMLLTAPAVTGLAAATPAQAAPSCYVVADNWDADLGTGCAYSKGTRTYYPIQKEQRFVLDGIAIDKSNDGHCARVQWRLDKPWPYDDGPTETIASACGAGTSKTFHLDRTFSVSDYPQMRLCVGYFTCSDWSDPLDR